MDGQKHCEDCCCKYNYPDKVYTHLNEREMRKEFILKAFSKIETISNLSKQTLWHFEHFIKHLDFISQLILKKELSYEETKKSLLSDEEIKLVCDLAKEVADEEFFTAQIYGIPPKNTPPGGCC